MRQNCVSEKCVKLLTSCLLFEAVFIASRKMCNATYKLSWEICFKIAFQKIVMSLNLLLITENMLLFKDFIMSLTDCYSQERKGVVRLFQNIVEYYSQTVGHQNR
jgi:hypothetical protein